MKYLVLGKNAFGECKEHYEGDDFYQAQKMEIRFMQKYKFVQSYVEMKSSAKAEGKA